jgi:hypothetical protein
VRVEVQGDANGAVPEPFAGDLGMDVGRQYLACMRMVQIVEPDAPQPALGDQLVPFVREAAGLDRLAVDARDHEAIVGQTDAEPQQLLRRAMRCARRAVTTVGDRSIGRTPALDFGSLDRFGGARAAPRKFSWKISERTVTADQCPGTVSACPSGGLARPLG